MSPDPRILVALVLLSFPFVVALQCSEGMVALEDEFPAPIALVNSSPDTLHIYTGGETFAPANRLPPGASRTVTTTVRTGGTYSFHAGQNGVDFPFPRGFQSCTVKVGAARTDTYRVVATPGDLECEGSGWGAGEL